MKLMKVGAVGCLTLVLVIIGLAWVGGFGSPEAAAKRTAETAEQGEQLREALAYLDDREALPEVAWWRVDGNSVVIGFTEWREDGQSVINAAAHHGNRAIGFGCHVYAVPADDTEAQTSGKIGRMYGTATVRHGQLE